MVAVTGTVPALVAMNEAILPDPLAARPIVVLLFVQVYTVPGTPPLKFTAAVALLLHTDWFATAVATGIGLTVTLIVCGGVLVQPNPFVTVIVPTYVAGAAAAGTVNVIGLTGKGALVTLVNPCPTAI